MTDLKTAGADETQANAGFRNRLKRFADESEGSFVVFSLFLLVCMMLAVGIAVDVMRFELTRTKLQNTLDRAVLAAADMDQTLEPEAVVADYFEKAGLGNFNIDISVDEGLNFRNVSASTEAEIRTLLMSLVGINNFTAPASSTAEERVSNVEISMVLDISGSMGSNDKIENLRVAAREFIDSVVVDDAEGQISLSLVPYTAQVNAGPNIFNQLNKSSNGRHNYSHCIDFDSSDFNTTTISMTKSYQQMQHFEWSSEDYRPIRNPGCPMQDYERIVPLSKNTTELKNTINNYRARANTAIHLGMKWGTALLDPSMRNIVNTLEASGVVDDEFRGRPADYDDEETLKVVVLMTDGENVDTYRIQDWAYNSSSEYQHWDNYSLWYYLYRYVNSRNRGQYYYRKYSSEQADSMLDNICTAAKTAGITVFTIGFEVTNYSAGVMQNCASSPSHFFRVEGTEISEAFSAIARQINQLRLIN
ncbi:TadE/TadG family type IV pilus assembly protein [Vannielia litorea]|nr:TadE/TadG family type IV pilus assembly protein [Vannielia litorea]